MEKLSGIYKIESIIFPNRIYIGSSKNINKRKIQHLSDLKLNTHKTPKLQYHYNKYGKNDLIFSVIKSCNLNELILNEQKFIDLLNPYFNTCKIAGSTLGNKWNEESRNKISLIHKGKIAWNRGITHSPETCKKISLIMTGKPRKKGRKLSIETKNKISESKLGKIPWNKGIKYSKEVCEKFSIAQKLRYKNI